MNDAVRQPTKRSKTVRRLRWLGAGLVLTLAIPLVFSKTLLCVDSGPGQRGEAIVLLGGGVFDRPPKVAELLKGGAAGRIIVTGDGDCDENRLALIAEGVPESVIELECRSRTTKENAEFTVPLLAAAGVKRAIIVTSWYHSRRALNTFRKFAPQIQFVSVPAYRSQRFRLSYTLLAIYKEYAKIAWYWIRWHVPPWQGAAAAV
jgi:uncharacterized SAM-binding protein YcdF (DUF218 family)